MLLARIRLGELLVPLQVIGKEQVTKAMLLVFNLLLVQP
jgi:hypothetical protein